MRAVNWFLEESAVSCAAVATDEFFLQRAMAAVRNATLVEGENWSFTLFGFDDQAQNILSGGFS